MTAAILTAVYDGYDTLKELPAQDVPVDAVCLTDDPTLTSASWRVLYAPMPNIDPFLAGKWPKMMPWLYTEATASVWVDASIRVTSPSFVSDLLDLADPLCQFEHRERDCVYDEAAFSRTVAKYADEPLDEQVARYRQLGHPEHWGLWPAGIIGRHHTPQVQTLGVTWLAEVHAWSYQDQVSQPVIMRQIGLRPRTIPGFYWRGENPWLAYEGSARH